MNEKNNLLNFKEIGLRIRLERERHGLSREKFAEIVGLSPFYIGQIERGDRSMSLDTLISIADTLNLSLDYILKGYTVYMEGISISEAVEKNYKDEIDGQLKELISLISGSPKEKFGLINDIIKLLLLY